MSTIDIEGKNGHTEETNIQDKHNVEIVKYKDIDKEYPEYHVGNEIWYHHVVAEHMLRISSKQFDRWCAQPIFEPKIEKRRFQTDHYSYIFVRLSDLQRIRRSKAQGTTNAGLEI